MNRPNYPRLSALLLAQLALASAASAGTVWDGGGADTNINTAANWDADTVNALNGTTTATFGTGGSLATLNVGAHFTTLSLNRTAATGFSIDGPGALTVSSSNSGSAANITASSALGGPATINAPLLIDTTNTTNRLLVINNNSPLRTLAFNGTVARTAGSTANFALRYSSSTNSITRFNTDVANLSNVQPGGTAWQSDLIFAGNQSSGSAITINSGSGFGNPTTNARLILGETLSDVQTWGAITLNNTIKIAIGGNVTAGAIAVGGAASAANTRIVGYTSANSSLSLASGTVGTNVTIGGGGTNENNLNIVKAGTGVLTLNGTHTYTGNTTVGAGTLSLVGSIASPVIVNAGATLSGEGTTTGSLTFAPGSSALSFDPSTQTVALSAASISATGSGVVVSPTSSLSDGTSYTVLKLTSGSFTGSPSEIFLLGSRGGSLSYTNNNTELTVTGGAAVPATLVWTGANGANPTFWDAATTVNWTNNGATDRYYSGDSVIFDDTATSTTVAIQGSSVSPTAITFNNGTKNYTLSGGAITGTTSFTKSGGGTVSLGTTGTSNFSGGVVLNDGALEFTALTQLGATTTSAQLNGGTLRFTGAATVTGNLPLTINANSTLDIGGGSTITVRIGGKVTGSGNITKTGTGILALGISGDTGPGNDFTGTVTVTNGLLDVRHADSLGSPTAGTSIQNATLLLQNFAQTSGIIVSRAEPLTFSGTSYLTLLNQIEGTTAKDFTNQFTGPITVGGTLNVATAVNASAVALKNTLLEFTGGTITTEMGSTLAFGGRPALPAPPVASNQTILVASPISGGGSVVVDAGTGSVITFNAAHTYAGATSVLSGSLKLASDSLPSATTLTIAASGATLVLDANDTVNQLFIGSTQMAAGTYGATGSGAATIDDLHFAGAGMLTVVSGPVVASPYETWADGFSLTGDNALTGSDPDGDGLINLLEYATGTSPVASGGTPGFGVAPSSGSLALTYTRVADPSLTYTVEGSSDLTGAWATVNVAGNPSTGSENVAGSVTILDTVPINSGKRFLRLKVTK